jgi:putative ABC transport system ATP-binding protein
MSELQHFIHHQPVVTLEDVSKGFNEDILNFDQLIIENISLSIQSGEFVIIFGPSGSGKSTLLNLIAGLERPSAGRVLIRGHDISKYTDDELARYHRRKMGMVFQSFNLIKSLTVWENVALPQTADGVPYFTRRHKAHHLLKLFGLQKYMHRHPNELSGGEQQRVAIARALVNNPLLLLVDEPTGNLDSKAADDVMRIFLGLHAHAKHTIVLVTHNPDYLAYASRVIYVQDGEIKKQEWKEQAAVAEAKPRPPLPDAAPYEQIRQMQLAEEGAQSQMALPPPELATGPAAALPKTQFSASALDTDPGASLTPPAVPDRSIEVKNG